MMRCGRMLLALLLCGLPASAAGTGTVDTAAPRAIIQQTADEVIAALQKKDVSLAKRRSEIEAIALKRFDFLTTAKLVLKRHWRRLSKQQKKQFVKEFRLYLASTYGGRLQSYQQQTVKVLGQRVEPRGDVTVHTRIVGGSIDGVAVDYRLRLRDGRWRIIDVIIEGISLVSNFRSQFAEVLSHGGPEELLRRLHEKNAATNARSEAGSTAGG